MPNFKLSSRSSHGLFSSKRSNDARSPNANSNPAKMGSIGESIPAFVDSVMTSNGGAEHTDGTGEPLVVDFATMHDTNTKEQPPPLTPTTSGKPSRDREASWLSDDETAAPPPPDFTRRDIHVPTRTSSSTPSANKKRLSLQRRMSSEVAVQRSSATPEPQPRARTVSQNTNPNLGTRGPHSAQMRSTAPTTLRSSADSVISFESSRASIATSGLPPLQQRSALEDDERLTPLLEDDPHSFDLVEAPAENERKPLSLENRSTQLLSKEHLQAIFRDTASLLRFTSFLSVARPKSLPILIYYLDALKALRAVNYANAVAEALEPISGLEFTEMPARPTLNAVLEEKAERAFEILVRDDLPAFITHVFVQVVSVSISKRVTGNLPPLLREASEGLAEVFCLTDPSRSDNPIIFASEEFHRTTQYGVSYAIGRNCRFLQGPCTSRSSVARFKNACVEGKEHSEILLNYRRDGSPFMNLLMMAPLLDSRGILRYFIGAQIDISGLVKDGTDLEAFRRMLDQQEGLEEPDVQKDEFQELSEMFNHVELETVRKFGGSMHREQLQEKEDAGTRDHKPRLLIQDQSTFDVDQAEKPSPKPEGRLSGPYKHYLIVRPAPSLRILFSSPSLRVPGILQSRFLDRIGGSDRVRDSLANALADGSRGVTAKVRWLSHAVSNLEESDEEGRPRWIHCTPLLGQSGSVGVWMVVLVDEKDQQPNRRFRQAPPVPTNIRGDQQYFQPPSRQYTSRAENYDDDIDSYPQRNPRTMNNGYMTPQQGRYMTVEAMRQPQSPRTLHNQSRNDQRAVRSNASSIKDYITNPSASTDSFRI